MEALLIRCISPLARSAKHTGCSAPSALFSHRHARKVRAARARILLDRGDDLGAQCTGALAPHRTSASVLHTRVTISQTPTPLARPGQSTRGLPSPLTALEGPCFTPRISARVRLTCLVPISNLP